MCGIAGGSHVNELVDAISHRGTSVKIDSTDFPLGHILLPIVNQVQQPLQRDGELVANCELYNWEALAAEHGIEARNDADLLLALLDQDGVAALEQVDGVYAFAYDAGEDIVLARDLLGVKPLFYATEPFAFASERQALEHAGLDPRELHPRHILRYNKETGEITTEYRGFFGVDEHATSLDTAAQQVADRLTAAVEKRVPDEPVALLFSGGLDSTLLAAILQQLDVPFTCYTAGIQYGNVSPARDREWASTVAEDMGLDLVSVDSTLDEVETLLPQLADWVSATSVVKLGVAVPFHLALQDASERVVFSGLGAEQLYAGYSRQQGDLNKEGVSGLRSLFHRDLYRDDVVAMRNGCELRVPFLDQALIRHALTIPGEHKVRDGYRKYVLRTAAEQLGVPEQVVWREKTAAQYGSNVDKAISRIAKDNGFDSKQTYCNTFRDTPDHQLAALVSGGKDSYAALYRMQQRNNKIACLVNLQADNEHSYMFDTKDQPIVQRQADQLALPLITQTTKGEKEEELQDLEQALKQAAAAYGVEGVVAGALASQYQRDRVEQVCERLGLKVFAPLWGTDPEAYLRWLVREGFQVMITHVAARGLTEDWVGRTLDTDLVEELIELSRKHRFNAAGEGGEYETAVTGFPVLDDNKQEPNQD